MHLAGYALIESCLGQNCFTLLYLKSVLLGLVWVISAHQVAVDVGSSIVSPPQQR